MEPRPHERGNPSLISPVSPVDTCFNGATSSRTWKLKVQRENLAAELASMEPRPHERGNGAEGEGRERREFASMEPRPHERGNACSASLSPRTRSLQWSHVLTNVETRPLRASPRRHTGAASMEPRPHERGNERRGLRETPLECASMEPRPHERGNLKTRRLLLLLILKASMEPRPHERGNACSRR